MTKGLTTKAALDYLATLAMDRQGNAAVGVAELHAAFADTEREAAATAEPRLREALDDRRLHVRSYANGRVILDADAFDNLLEAARAALATPPASEVELHCSRCRVPTSEPRE